MARPATRLGPGDTVRALLALTRGDRVDHLTALARAHPDGCLLDLGFRRILVTGEAAGVKHVLVERPDRYVKGLGQRHAREMIGQGLLTAEGDRWDEQRRSAQRFLRARSVHEHLPRVIEHAAASAAELREAVGTTVDLTTRLADYTLNCLAEVFGFRAPDARVVHEAFDVIQDEAIFRAVTQGAVPPALRPRQAARVRRALGALRDEARASLPPEGRDEPWADDEGMMSLFLAGYETTASTLAWTAGFVVGDPALQVEIAREARRLPNADDATPADLARLAWSTATVQESLRLRPPVWLISRRAVSRDRVAGVDIRPGDEVLVLPGAVADRSPFDPAGAMGQRPSATLAFGAGPRACPGGSLAMMEATLWLSLVLREVEFVPGTPAGQRPSARMSQAPSRGAVVHVRSRPQAHRSIPSPVYRSAS